MNSHLESATQILMLLYSPFYLTLFFFCSGYTYRHAEGFLRFLVKKIRQLFIPWLIFSVANILLAQILTFNAHPPLGRELLLNFLQIRGAGDGLWFIAALFITFIPFYFFIRWYERNPGKIRGGWLVGISLLLSIASTIYAIEMDPSLLPWNSAALPWHIEYIFIAMFYMVLGYLFRTKFEKHFDQYNSAGFRVLIWGLYLCAIFAGGGLVHDAYLNQAWTYLKQLLGVAAVISLCKVLPENRMVLYIGQNTLLCFALHGKGYSAIQILLRKVIPNLYGAILRSTLASLLFSVLLTWLLSILLVVPIWCINRWLPFTVGRKRNTEKH